MAQRSKMTLSMRLARAVLRLFGWRVVSDLPPTDKFIMVGAWHTSNWDFPLSMFAMWGLGVKLHFIGKKELLEGPLGGMMRRFGVIGIDRSKRNQFVKRIADLFETHEELRIVVPAEGTRGKTEYWRTGFYYMALAANVPIAFAQVDSVKKEVGIGGYFYPRGDREADLQVVKDFYKDKRGLKPHKQGEIRFRPLEKPSG